MNINLLFPCCKDLFCHISVIFMQRIIFSYSSTYKLQNLHYSSVDCRFEFKLI
uniref:Uncharacterized protein n=1 Tax=Rhizophora mucronata TaxID=61149 RepID=A0A2P2QYQ0_RHIMU